MTPLQAWSHRGAAPATWGNLGQWQPGDDYPTAARRLALRVLQAAHPAPGATLLHLGCGAGDELLLSLQALGAALVWAVEPDARAGAQGRRRLAEAGLADRVRWLPLPAATALRQLRGEGLRVHAVVCVDAAYHLSPRAAWLADAAALLRPGGRLAFTDLVAPSPGRALRAAARLCGVDPADLGPAGQRLAQLAALGLKPQSDERLDEAVLDGFAAFVRAQRRHHGWGGPGALRAHATAALIGPARRRGLGYALFAAGAG